MSQPEFSTVMTSMQPELIAQAAAVLESAGIPYQNPGYQHGSLMPLVSIVTIELRVPTHRLDEARRAIGDIQELVRDGEQAPHPVFRLNRSNGTLYLIVGGVLGGIGFLFASSLIVGVPRWALGLASLSGPLLGFLMGLRSGKDYCSSPGCPGELPATATVCSRCNGVILGRIKHASDHFDAVDRARSSPSS
jgi:hypothetical protein